MDITKLRGIADNTKLTLSQRGKAFEIWSERRADALKRILDRVKGEPKGKYKVMQLELSKVLTKWRSFLLRKSRAKMMRDTNRLLRNLREFKKRADAQLVAKSRARKKGSNKIPPRRGRR
ncbi:MAG: hypothetical protein AABX02_01875 [archaeon]